MERMIPRSSARWAAMTLSGLLLLAVARPASAIGGILPGPDTLIESRILWVENRMKLSLSRFHQLFLLKNRGNDLYSTPVLPPLPPPNVPASVGLQGVSGMTQSAQEGMGQALSALPQTQGLYESGSGISAMAYSASPEGAIRLGADMEGRMFQTLISIHQDLLYLLKVQSSRTGLKGAVIDQSHADNLRDQEILKLDLPSWIMYR